MSDINRRFCIAPMLDCTDRHARYFLRLFSKNILLYTEMITAAAIIHGDRDYLLGFNEAEHPIAVQLGGADPESLKIVARICQEYGYDEINLNVGCPSDRVQSGRFGACLMASPDLVADCVAAVKSTTSIPVTVKHRIGIDDMDSFEQFCHFAEIQINAGVDALIVHARKAWLQGLSPKQNREIPELKYDWVYDLKALFPDVQIIINGGIKTLEQCHHHLQQVDGVMLGREAYHNPFILAEVDNEIFQSGRTTSVTRLNILHRYYEYIEQQLSMGLPPVKLIRHILGLFHSQPNARVWRRHLTEKIDKKTASLEDLYQAEKILT